MSTVTLHSEKKKSLVPKLRFPGFEGEWGNYSLKKIIVDLNSGISVNSDDFPIQNDLEVGILKTSCVANGIFKESENKKIVENEVSRAKLNPTKNEIIISRMNTPQLVGESGYIDRDYPSLFIPDRLWQTVVNQELCNSRWLSYFLITEKVRDNLKSIATGTSGTMKNISKPNFLSINVLIPTLPEQQKIASFLSAVDEKIQQLSRKKELLEQYKKGVMQQLFSGKLRFKDENGKDYPDWEETKIGKIFEHRNETGYNEMELLSVSINNGVYSQSQSNKIDNSNSDKSKYKRVLIGDIAYNSMRMWQGASSVSTLDGIVSPAYTILQRNENNCSEYFGYLFKMRYMIQTFQKHSQGLTSDTWNLKYPMISQIKVKRPCLKEQQKIANFLSGINDKIEQVNGELVKTQEFKKGLLQQLFV
jgi:type I restriction enzyme S subunit